MELLRSQPVNTRVQSCGIDHASNVSNLFTLSVMEVPKPEGCYMRVAVYRSVIHMQEELDEYGLSTEYWRSG